MNDLTLWLTMLGMGAITYGQRLSFIVLSDRLRLPPLVRRGLRFVPVTILPAIIFPELLLRDGALLLSPLNFRLVAGMVAALVAWRTRNVLLTIAVGMGVLWGLSWLF